MENINWNDALFITQILIFIGAFGGQLTFCMMILMLEFAFVLFIATPCFIFFAIKALLGFEIAICAAILFAAFIAYYIYTDRQWEKYFKNHG